MHMVTNKTRVIAKKQAFLPQNAYFRPQKSLIRSTRFFKDVLIVYYHLHTKYNLCIWNKHNSSYYQKLKIKHF